MSKIITPDGVEHNLTELDFVADEEVWIEIKVKDGSIIKFRTTIESVCRSDKHAEDGSPVYLIKTSNHMRYIQIPPELIQAVKPKKISGPQEAMYR